MEFKNEHNEKIVLPISWWQVLENNFSYLIFGKPIHKRREIWLSRAVAVVASIVVIKDDVPYILINQRGSGAADFHGLWNIPCGYLDYGETSGEATIREVWEECGVDLTKLIGSSTVNYMDSVWDTNTLPTENRQNVTLHHGLIANVDELPSTSLENNEPDEVEDVKWIPLKDYKKYEYAFGHEKRIVKFIKKTKLKY